jgi:hypothetical protein
MARASLRPQPVARRGRLAREAVRGEGLALGLLAVAEAGAVRLRAQRGEHDDGHQHRDDDHEQGERRRVRLRQ